MKKLRLICGVLLCSILITSCDAFEEVVTNWESTNESQDKAASSGQLVNWVNSGFDGTIRTYIKVQYPIYEDSDNCYVEINFGLAYVEPVAVGYIVQKDLSVVKQWDWLIDNADLSIESGCEGFECDLTYTGHDVEVNGVYYPVFYVENPEYLDYRVNYENEAEDSESYENDNVINDDVHLNVEDGSQAEELLMELYNQGYTDTDIVNMLDAGSDVNGLQLTGMQMNSIEDTLFEHHVLIDYTLDFKNTSGYDIKDITVLIVGWDEDNLPLKTGVFYPYYLIEDDVNIKAGETYSVDTMVDFRNKKPKYLKVFIQSVEGFSDNEVFENPTEDLFDVLYSGEKFDESTAIHYLTVNYD